MISSYFDQFFYIGSYSSYLICNLVSSMFIALIIFWQFKPSILLITGNMYEFLLITVHKIFQDEVKQTIKDKEISNGYLTLILSLFFFVLFLNIAGLIPYCFSPTVHISITIGLSLTIVAGSTLHAVYKFKDNYFANFTPSGSPIFLAPFLVLIETVSHIAKIISLGVRLAANITAGHLLLSIFSTFGLNLLTSSWFVLSIFPGSILLFVVVLEFAVAFIQAYVFVLLTVIYISEGYHSH